MQFLFLERQRGGQLNASFKELPSDPLQPPTQPLHYLQVCCVKSDITKELEIE